MNGTHLPEAQTTVTDAFICGQETRTVPGDGVWLYRMVKRINGGLSPLLAVYSDPDAGRPSAGIACTAELPDPLVVFLHSDAGVEAARAPWNECGKPTRNAATAFHALTTTIIWVHKDRRVQSQQSIESQCSDTYKDTLAIYEKYSPHGTNRAGGPARLTAPISVCTYNIETDAEGDRVGHLDGHQTLTTDEISAINGALTHVRVDPTCSRHVQTRFALLTNTRTSTVIALDGCAVSDDGGWWRAGDDVRSVL